MSLLPGGGGYYVPSEFARKLLNDFSASATSFEATSLEARIENQVEIDALRLEARQIWEARRAALTPEERELEDLEIDLEDLNRGIHAREAEGG